MFGKRTFKVLIVYITVTFNAHVNFLESLYWVLQVTFDEHVNFLETF